jgi:DNA-binding NtrC family response regulator
MRDLLSRAIASWDFVTACAKSGEEALRSMDAEPSRIVLLDLNLPAMSGIQAFEQIRSRWPETRVIILTGFGDLDAAKQAIHLDVVEFLTKPCHLGDLERALDRARRQIEEAEPLPTVQGAGGDDEPEARAPMIVPEPAPPGSGVTLDEVERQHILAALARNQGNRAATATELGISLRTLYYRLNEYQKQGHRID